MDDIGPAPHIKDKPAVRLKPSSYQPSKAEMPVEAIASGPINGLDANMFISCNRSASAELLDKRAQVHYFVGRRSSVAIP